MRAHASEEDASQELERATGVWRAATCTRSTRPSAALLLGLVAWTLALRIWVAWPNPTPTRFWDERYSVQNVYRLAASGDLRPANGYHPGLSYLPQALVVLAAERVLGDGAVVRPPGKGRLTPLGYRLCRFVQVAYGVGTALLAFLLARRVLGATGGLIAALLLAGMPWHLRQSVIFKPDILLILMTLAVLLCAARLLERASLKRVAVLSIALGASLASKFNAAPLVVPAVVAVVWASHGASGGRLEKLLRSLGCLMAGATVTLIACSPFLVLEPSLYAQDFGVTMDDYEAKADRAGVSRWSMPAHALVSLAGWNFHGPVVLVLGLVAMLLPLSRSVRERLSSLQCAVWLVLSSFVLSYVGSYALVTANPSPHNWLVLSPVVCVASAALICVGWRKLVGAAGVWTAGALTTLAVMLSTVPIHQWAYRNAVPATVELAETVLTEALGSSRDRIVASDVVLRPSLAGHAVQDRTLSAASRALIVPAAGWDVAASGAGLDDASPSELDTLLGLDGLVLRSAALEAGDRDRLEEFGFDLRFVEGAPWRARGEDLVVASRRFRLLSRSGWRETGPQGEMDQAEAPSGSWVSFEVASAGRDLRARAGPTSALQPVPCVESSRGGSRKRCVIKRLRSTAKSVRLLQANGSPAAAIGYRALLWQED